MSKRVISTFERRWWPMPILSYFRFLGCIVFQVHVYPIHIALCSYHSSILFYTFSITINSLDTQTKFLYHQRQIPLTAAAFVLIQIILRDTVALCDYVYGAFIDL